LLVFEWKGVSLLGVGVDANVDWFAQGAVKIMRNDSLTSLWKDD